MWHLFLVRIYTHIHRMRRISFGFFLLVTLFTLNSKSYFHSFEVFHFIPEFTYWHTRLKLLVALKILTATKRYIYTFVEATPVMIVWRHRNCDNVKTKGKFTVMLGASAAHFRVNNRFQCIETLFCLQHCCLLRTSAEMYKRMHKHIDRICICHSHFVWDLKGYVDVQVELCHMIKNDPDCQKTYFIFISPLK